MLPIARFKIEGHSMEPTIKTGSVIWVFRWAYFVKSPKLGDVVAFKRDDKIFVKRIVSRQNNGYLLEGDNKNDSLDSRKFGMIKKNEIIGKVI